MDLPLRELLPQNRDARRRRGIDAATAGSQSEGRAQGGAVVFDRRPDVADDGCPSHALSHALSPSHARVRARDSEPVMRPALKPGFEERKGLPPVVTCVKVAASASSCRPRKRAIVAWSGIRFAAITRKATSSRQRRSIPRLERSPTAYAYNNNATIIAGSNDARPQPSSR
jgi:hypothetical protein